MNLESEEKLKPEEMRLPDQVQVESAGEGVPESETEDGEGSVETESQPPQQLKKAHDNWRESWYARYSKAVPNGMTWSGVMLLSGAAIFGEMAVRGPGESVVANNLTGLEQLGLFLGPSIVAEIGDVIPRTITMVKARQERKTEEFDQVSRSMLSYSRSTYDRWLQDLTRCEMEVADELGSDPDPREVKKRFPNYGPLKRYTKNAKKAVDHWQKIRDTRFAKEA